jgi:signal transduction histidine kinase
MNDGGAPETRIVPENITDREREQAQYERDQAQFERDQARRERDQARRERDQARAERDSAYLLLKRAQEEWGNLTRDSEMSHLELSASNQELQRQVDFQFEQDQHKTRFYANMNHELRTPLSSIIGFSEDALDGLAGDLKPEQRRYVANILNSARHLLAVITELLDLSKLQDAKLKNEPRLTSLREIVAEAEAMMAPLMVRKGQILVVSDLSNLPPVMVDPDRVVQILLNLLSNAHKFTPRGGRVAISASVEGMFVRVAVQDNGVGIARSDLPYLFEEFTRVSKRGKLTPPGTGLGLAITKHLVELQGGSIEVDSEPHEGSTFTFTLPLPLSPGMIAASPESR